MRREEVLSGSVGLGLLQRMPQPVGGGFPLITADARVRKEAGGMVVHMPSGGTSHSATSSVRLG